MTDQPISQPQRRKLFAVARERGLTHDDLRAMTPAGSVSALSYHQAAELLTRLCGKPYRAPERRRRRSRRTGAIPIATNPQKFYIRILADQLGLSKSQLDAYIRSRHHRNGLADVIQGKDASDIIEGLKAQVSRLRELPSVCPV